MPGNAPRQGEHQATVTRDQSVKSVRVAGLRATNEIGVQLGAPGELAVAPATRDYTDATGCLGREIGLLTRSAQAAVALCFVAAAISCRPVEQRPVVLITIDTLRADHVGAYGAAPLPTPNLDRIAREGALYENAYAPMPRTSQSVGSILTGLHPLRHGADGLGMTLPPNVVTLGEAFKSAGYATAAFTSNVFLRGGLGYEQGFDVYSNPQSRWWLDSAASQTREVLAWLANATRAPAPFFLWVHYFDPHWPYDPPPRYARLADEAWAGRPDFGAWLAQDESRKGELIFRAPNVLAAREIEHLQRLYAAEVASTDAAIGELLSGLEQLKLLDRAVLLLTSDHGESLGEHEYWFGHGEFLYDETLRVPLMIRAPQLAAERVRETATLEDVMPTLLQLAGVEVPDGLDGRSVVPSDGQAPAGATEVIHLTDHLLVHPENPRRPVPDREGRWWSIRSEGWKLIEIPQAKGTSQFELYDTARDRGESDDKSASEAPRLADLQRMLQQRRQELLRDFRAAPAAAGAPDRATLRSLGYVH